MSHPAVTIEATAPVTAALRIFRELGFRRLPVTRDDRLVGIIAPADLLKLMAQSQIATMAEGIPAGG